MYTLTRPNVYETIIKKSRFIATATPVATVEEALSLISDLSKPDATHNCWAYKIGDEYRFYDDGEPGGTAGRPILNAIEGRSLDNVVVVVTRYFGGIKLGAGGLVRAYGGAAAECLRTTEIIPLKCEINLSISVPFTGVGALYAILEKLDAKKTNESFTTHGVVLDITIDAEKKEELTGAVASTTRGLGRIEPR